MRIFAICLLLNVIGAPAVARAEWRQQFVSTIGSGISDVVQITESGLAIVDGEQLFFLSTESWSVEQLSPCAGSIGGVAGNDTTVVVGCSDGTILTINPADYTVGPTETRIDTSEILGVEIYNDDAYIVAASTSGGNPKVHHIDLDTLQEQSSGFPTTLSFANFTDTAVVGSFIVVSQGAASLSKVDPISGGVTRNQNGPTAVQLSDVLPSDSGANALVAAGTGGIIRLLFASNETQFASGSSVSDVVALAADGDRAWVADAGSASLKSFTYTSGSETVGTEVLSELFWQLEGEIVEMVALNDVVVAGTDTGSWVAFGEKPWVTVALAPSGPFSWEDQFEVSFSSDVAGEYSVAIVTDATETVLVTGSIAAEEQVEVPLQIDSSYAEGQNELRVTVTDSANANLKGSGSVYISVDNPPVTPTLGAQDIGFGNQRLTLTFDASEEADISSYLLYMSEVDFLPDDYSTGGPTLPQQSSESDTGVLVESALEQTTLPGEVVRFTVDGLVNDQEYFLAVRAVDAGGLQSPLSNRVSAIPRDTMSASELAGEQGGFPSCSSLSSEKRKTPVWLPIVLVMVGVVSRRRSN